MKLSRTFIVLPILVSSLAFTSALAQDSLRISIQAAMLAAPKTGVQAQVAESRVREAEAKVDQAKSALLPSLEATGSNVIHSYNYAAMMPPALLKKMVGPNGLMSSDLISLWNVQDARLGTHISLFNYSSWKRYDEAKMGITASHSDAEIAANQASLTAADAWLGAARALQAVHSHQHELDLAQQSLAMTMDQKSAGTVTQFDVVRAQGQVAVATAGLTMAQGQKQIAEINLQRALGLKMSTVITLTDSLLPPVPEDKTSTDSYVEQAMRERPEVLSAQQKLDMAVQEASAIDAEDYPSVDFAADYGASAYQFGSNEFTGTVAVQLTWDLYDGGRKGSRKLQQQEHITQARLQLNDVKQSIEQDVRSSISQMSTARDLVKAAQEQLSLVNQELEMAQERFKSGMSGLLDVITAQKNLSSAEDTNIEALYQFNKARLYFLKATHHLENL